MWRVRKALDYLEDNYSLTHPLVQYRFRTDGIDIFLEHARELEIISQDVQLAIRQMLEIYLDCIEWDARQLAARLYPYARSHIDDIRVIVIDPGVSFGRPVISGSGIPTAINAERFEAGEQIKELTRDYGMRKEEIEEAIRCELNWKAA